MGPTRVESAERGSKHIPMANQTWRPCAFSAPLQVHANDPIAHLAGTRPKYSDSGSNPHSQSAGWQAQAFRFMRVDECTSTHLVECSPHPSDVCAINLASLPGRISAGMTGTPSRAN